MDQTDKIVGLSKELDGCRAAGEAMRNEAIMTYFERARDKAVGAMLNPQLDADEQTLWRLRSIAQTVDGLLAYLKQQRDLTDFVEAQLKEATKENSDG